MKNNNIACKYTVFWIPSAVPFFLFGFLYYLLSPFFVIYYLPNNIIVDVAKNYIDLTYFDFRYFIDLIQILVFWLSGYFLIQKISFKNNISIDRFSFFKFLPKLFSICLSLFLILLIFKLQKAGIRFFSGYKNYDISILGQISTLVFFLAFCVNFFSNRIIKKYLVILFIISSVLILGLGSRMFFVLGFITVILGYISRHKAIVKNLFFLFFIGFIIVLVISVGLWRQGGISDFSIEDSIAVFFAEPLFTATSGSIYFENFGGRPLLSFPKDIFASFVNFIPTIFFPNKLLFINSFTNDVNKYSPFGASALFSNIYSNFGIFYPLYFLFIGSFFGYLKKQSNKSEFYRATYFTVLPLLMFHFYRAEFITVIKALFFNGFILPFVLFSAFLSFNKLVRAKS